MRNALRKQFLYCNHYARAFAIFTSARNAARPPTRNFSSECANAQRSSSLSDEQCASQWRINVLTCTLNGGIPQRRRAADARESSCELRMQLRRVALLLRACLAPRRRTRRDAKSNSARAEWRIAWQRLAAGSRAAPRCASGHSSGAARVWLQDVAADCGCA